ncbi:hypothetical protein ACFLZV_01900 [Candidatus Margulisiibacteriota bacterium]
MKKKIIFLLLFFFLSIINIYANDSIIVIFENTFFSAKTSSLLEGPYETTANICSGTNILWSEKMPQPVTYNQGIFHMTLGENKALPVSVFNNPTLNLLLEIPDDSASFSIQAIPYAIQAKTVENVLYASADRVVGSFTSTVNIDANLFAGNTTKKLFVSNLNKKIGIGKTAPQTALDIEGYVNISASTNGKCYLQKGENLFSIFAWDRQEAPNTQNIYYKPSDNIIAVGINTSKNITDTFTIVGTVNAQNYVFDFDKVLSWKTREDALTRTNYYPGMVGMGRNSPYTMLDVSQAILFSNTNLNNSGTMRWHPDYGFQGYKNGKWIDMVSIKGDGIPNKLVNWRTETELSAGQQLTWDEQAQRLGINTESPIASLDINYDGSGFPGILAGNTSDSIFYVGEDGKVGIGTAQPGKDWPNEKYDIPLVLDVNGIVEASKLYVYGVSIKRYFKKGESWRMNRDGNIYYIRGHVGIGRPDPGLVPFKGNNPNYLDEEIGNTLELAAPNKYPEAPTVDPAITFSIYKDDNVLHNYTMGVDANTPGIFRIEKSSDLGTTAPLFIAYKQKLAIGIDEPKVNLHVSGNLGTVMMGKLNGVTTSNITGPGTRFIWMPSKAAIRIGHISEESKFAVESLRWDYIGRASAVIGTDSIATGNFSAILGGKEHEAGGAYATVLGGKGNVVQGDWGLALGHKAKAYHHGSFVWTDGRQDDSFHSQMENQFLIHASGGVGIGTANTGIIDTSIRAALTIATNNATSPNVKYLVKAKGPDNSTSNIFVITTPGDITIGSDVDDSDSVIDERRFNILNGNVGVNTVNAPYALTIIERPDTPIAFICLGKEDHTTSPAMVVANTANVGMGMFPETIFEGSEQKVELRKGGFLQVASGDVQATTFIFPDGQKISTGGPVIVWSWRTPILFSDFASIEAISKNITAQTEIWNSLNSNGYLDDNGGVTAKFDPNNMDQIFIDLGSTYGIQAVSIHQILKNYAVAAGTNPAPVTPNIAFISGNVGIGTITPNSLLELSNFGSEREYNPLITFDMGGTDLFSLGVAQNNPRVLKIQKGGSDIFDQDKPILAVSGNNVGIGIADPKANLHVQRDTIIHQQMRINTENIAYELSAPTVNVNKLYINRDDNTAGGTKWAVIKDQNERIWYQNRINDTTFSYIGIGTSLPQAHLHIPGTLRVNTTNLIKPSVKIRNNFDVKTLSTTQLKFRDATAGDTPKLFVDDNKLFLAGAEIVNVSDIFSAATGPGGFIAIWLPEETRHTSLGNSLIYWDDKKFELSLTNNISFSHYYNDNDQFSISNRLLIGTSTQNTSLTYQTDEIRPFLSLNSDISKSTSPFDTRNHLAKRINLLLPNINAPSENISIRGLQINLEQPDDVYLKNNSYAKALEVDVSKVGIIPGDNQLGYKYAAIFKTGTTTNVGINITPNVALDVLGIVSANSFVISKRLSISTLNVINSSAPIEEPGFSVLTPGKIGIGTSEPQTELEIIGEGSEIIRTDTLRAHGIKAGSLETAGGGSVAKSEKIGMGTSSPVSQWQIDKTIYSFRDIVPDKYTSQKIMITNEFATLSKDTIRAFDIKVQTEEKNKIGPITNDKPRVVTGINIDLSELANTENVLVGLKLSAVSKNMNGITQNIAVFDGKVGIGDTRPEYPLVVNGTIKAKNMLDIVLDGDQHAANFNKLVNRTTTASNYIAKDLYVNGDIMIATLNIPNDNLLLKYNLNSYQKIIVPELNAVTVNISTITDAKETSAEKVSADIGLFSAVAVNTEELKEYMTINGSMISARLVGTYNISADSLNINNNLVLSNGKIGINTSDLDHFINIKSIPTTGLFQKTTFKADDNRTWNPIIIQSKTASVNESVGISLIPRIGTDKDISTGIIAVRSNDGPITGSHLVFVSVPNDDSSREAMRITSEGDIGLSAINPSSNLHITKGAIISEDFIATQSFIVNNITAINNLNINSTLNVMPTTDIWKMAAGTLEFKLMDMPNQISGFGSLFVSQQDNELYYCTLIDNQIVSGNFQATFNISADIPALSIPYYSDQYKLQGSSLFWLAGSGGLDISDALRLNADTTITSGNAYTTVINTIPSDNVFDKFVAQRIGLIFEKTEKTSSFITGVSINALENIFDLAQDDVVVGLKVAMDTRLTGDDFTLNDGTPVIGKQYSAYFLNSGGSDLNNASANVGIATSLNAEIFHPSADLHIASNVENQAAFQVDLIRADKTTINALVISANGYVSVGTALSISNFTIKAQDQNSQNSVFDIRRNDNPLLFVRNDSKIGFGTSSPQTTVEATDAMKGNSLTAHNLSSNLMAVNIENNSLVVTINGYVGFGTNAPESQLHFLETLSDPTVTKPFSFEDTSLIISDTQNVEKNLIGLDLNLVSHGDYNWFSGADTLKRGYMAKGLNIDLSTINIVTGNKLIGIQVDLPKDTNYPQYQEKLLVSAIFLGGNVGVGATSPEELLDVNGTLKAKDIIISDTFVFSNIDVATFNNIVISTDAVIENLYVKNATASIEVKNELYIKENLTTGIDWISAEKKLIAGGVYSQIATINNLRINTSNNIVASLNIDGSALVNSAATINQLNLAELKADKNLFIYTPTFNVSGNIRVSADKQVEKIAFSGTATPDTVFDYGNMFVSNIDDNIYYTNDSTTVNLGGRSLGTSGRIPYFDGSSNLGSEAYLEFTTAQTAGTYRVGTANKITSIIKKTLVDQEKFPAGSIFAAESIELDFAKRVNHLLVNKPMFAGVSINMYDAANFGTLTDLRKEKETYIGVYVDVRDLQTNQRQEGEGGAIYKGKKYAAVFLANGNAANLPESQHTITPSYAASCNVAVIPSANQDYDLTAHLHIINSIDQNAFVVESRFTSGITEITRNALIVSADSQITIGPAAPSAQLTVSNYDENALQFAVVARDGSHILTVGKDNEFSGIGTDSPDSGLHIINTNTNTAMIIDVSSSNPTSVDNDGKIGIGTLLPSANLHVYLRPERFRFEPVLYLFAWNDTIDGTPRPDPNPALRQIKYWYRGIWTSYGYGFYDSNYDSDACDPLDPDQHAAQSYTIQELLTGGSESGLAFGATDGVVTINASVFAASTPEAPNALIITKNGDVVVNSQVFPTFSIPLQVGGHIYVGKSNASLLADIPGNRPVIPEWAPGVYKIGDRVIYQGIVYFCLWDHDSTNEPIAHWNPPALNSVSDPDPWYVEDPDVVYPKPSLPFGLITKTNTGYGAFLMRQLNQDNDLIIQWNNKKDDTSTNKDAIVFLSGKVADGQEVMRITFPSKAFKDTETYAVLPNDGRVGIGTTDPQATLAIQVDRQSPPPLWVGVDIKPNRAFFQGNWVEQGSYKDSGYDVNLQSKDYNVYLDESNTEFVIWYTLIPSAVYQAVDMTTPTTQNMAIIATDNRTERIFHGDIFTSPSEPKNTLIVNSDGQVGINTTKPAAHLDVNGTSNIFSIVIAKDGTRMTILEPTVNTNAYSLMVSSNISSEKSFVITAVHDGSEEIAFGEKVEVTIDKQDLNGNLGAGLLGVGVDLKGELAPFPTHAVSYNAVLVDITDLNVKDVSDITMDDGTPVGWTKQGQKYAAAFLGAGVGIGTSAPEARLHVLPLLINGHPTDNYKNFIPIARFDTKETRDFIEVYCKGRQTDYQAVPPLVFTSVPGVSRLESKAIFQSLLNHDILNVVTSNPVLASDNTRIDTPFDPELYPPYLIGKVVPNPEVGLDDPLWDSYVLPYFQINAPDPPNIYITSITVDQIKRILGAHKAKGVVTFRSGQTELSGDDNGKSFLFLTTGLESYNSGDVMSQIESTGNVEEIFIKTKNRISEGSGGSVGVNVVTPDATLHVDGEMRVGMVTQNSSTSEEGGPGGRLYFSGGSALAVNDSENNDEIWMGRWNVKTVGRQDVGLSELLVSFGDYGYEPNSSFLVRTSRTDGYSDDALASVAFSVRCFGFRDEEQTKIAPRGMVGIATANALATLHVVGTSNSTSSEEKKIPVNHMVLIEDHDELMAGVAIRYTTPIGKGSNYMTFLIPSRNPETEQKFVIGKITGVGSDGSEPGIRLSSSHADYAEYLPKLYKTEKFHKGEIIGVKGGKITKDTTDAEQIMVISSAPIVIGNWPGQDKESLYAPVAFLGQVPVKIKGRVKAGDYIVPTGLNDGIGIAVSSHDITPEMVDSILGIAWETSNQKEAKLIKALIGFPSNLSSLIKEIESMKKIKQEISLLKENNNKLKETYSKKLSDRQKQINSLKTKI